MFAIVPTWIVTLDNEGREFRVPRTKLDDFLSVLLLNDVKAFSVRAESVSDYENSSDLVLDGQA